ncbi:MAG: DUF4352 domain-containing protein [Micromonosporaceae bacterium]
MQPLNDPDQPGYRREPPAGYHGPPPKNRGSRLAIGMLIGALGLLLCVCGGGAILMAATDDADRGGSSLGDGIDAVPPKVARVGEPVRDGDLEIVVHDVSCGKTQIGPDFMAETAQGKFCLVDLSVKNTGNDVAAFWDTDQKAIDSQGRRHSVDSWAGLEANEDDAFLEDINPGNTVRGFIVFDIPKDAELTKLVLQGPNLGEPVMVTLKK